MLRLSRAVRSLRSLRAGFGHATLVVLIIVVAAGAVGLAGCGGDDPAPSQPVPTDPGPLNDTPDGALARLKWAYENENADAYAKMFTNDFHFLFSAEADPDLVTQYGANWNRNDETISATHMFTGFTNGEGDPVQGALRIEIDSGTSTSGDHPDFPLDSLAYYEWASFPDLGLTIEVPGSSEPLVYFVAGRHEFFLVRGDAAVLVDGQEARSNRWYVRRWADMTAPIGSPAERSFRRLMPADGTTWGKLKSTYR